MPRLNEVSGLTEFVIELKDEQNLPWESETKENIRAAVIEKFGPVMKPNGSIIPLRDLYRKAKLAEADGSVVSSGKTVEHINPKGRGGKERVWAARRQGMGMTLLATATGLSAAELKAILKDAPDGDQMLKRSYGLDEEGNAKWSEGAAKIHAAKVADAPDVDEDEDDEEDDAPVEPTPAPKRRRRAAN